MKLEIQLDQRIAQVRGEMKVAARTMVVPGFNLDGLTPAQKAAKVLTLTSDRMFQLHYEFIDEVCHQISFHLRFIFDLTRACSMELVRVASS